MFYVGGENPAEKEKEKIKKQSTTGIIFWNRAGRMGSTIHAEGLSLARSTDGSSIVTGEETEYSVTNACRWVDVVVGACGNSLLTASIFSEK